MSDDLSFPAALRLRVSADYDRVWQKGRRCHTTHFIVIGCPAGTDRSRLGITVSRKVGNAVCRNRLKRWIREYFRQHRHELTPAIDISVVAKRQAGTMQHADVERELRQAFARLEKKVDV